MAVTLFDIIKAFLVVGLIMYSIFAAVIIKQTNIMAESIEDEFNVVISIFAWVHLIVTLSLVVVALLL